MIDEIRTFIANMQHAARTGQTVTIGGGEFSPDELQRIANALIEELIE